MTAGEVLPTLRAFVGGVIYGLVMVGAGLAVLVGTFALCCILVGAGR